MGRVPIILLEFHVKLPEECSNHWNNQNHLHMAENSLKRVVAIDAFVFPSGWRKIKS